MKFLCDVHISYKVVKYLRSLGFETLHVNEILDKWYTKDGDICRYADERSLVVITKDTDFKNSFLLRNTPSKLIKISLGNVSTSALIQALSANMLAIQHLNAKGNFMVELDQHSATFIEKER